MGNQLSPTEIVAAALQPQETRCAFGSLCDCQPHLPSPRQLAPALPREQAPARLAIHKGAGAQAPGAKRVRGPAWLPSVPSVTVVEEGVQGGQLATVLEFVQVGMWNVTDIGRSSEYVPFVGQLREYRQPLHCRSPTCLADLLLPSLQPGSPPLSGLWVTQQAGVLGGMFSS